MSTEWQGAAEMRQFQERVRAERLARGISIRDAADAAGIEWYQWQRYERQRVTPLPVPTLRAMLAAVGLTDATLREVGLL